MFDPSALHLSYLARVVSGCGLLNSHFHTVPRQTMLKIFGLNLCFEDLGYTLKCPIVMTARLGDNANNSST